MHRRSLNPAFALGLAPSLAASAVGGLAGALASRPIGFMVP